MNSFGTDFVLVSDVIQPLDSSLPYGPWIHLATIQRGLDEYIVFKQATTNKVYIEKVIRHLASLKLQLIKDDTEWSDLLSFCKAAGLLDTDTKKEIKLSL